MVEGDPVAIMKGEDFKKVNNVDSLDELWRNLRDYVGTFRYRRLLFFNDWAYGCFVYRIGEPDDYVEHLTVDAMSFESFRRTVERLMRDVVG